MNTKRIENPCPKCGEAIPGDAPQELCLRCVFAGAAVSADAGRNVAAAFPQLEIIELMGVGGMGVVYKARQPKLDRLTQRVKMSLVQRCSVLVVFPALMGMLFTPGARAQAGLPIYTDHLVNGFQSWSWAVCNFKNSAPVQSGAYSIAVNATAWEALWLHQNSFDTTLYSNLTFWINGGPGGGQIVDIVGTVNGNSASSYALPKLPANSWQQFSVPLSSLGVAGQSSCTGFQFQLNGNGASTTNTFYVDGVQLTGKGAPTLTHISVNASQPIRTADARWFGVNTAVWDGNLDTPQTASLLQEAGLGTFRFPGGSLSDVYHWSSNKTIDGTVWATSFSKFAQLATKIGAQAFITVNYGTGTPTEAAAWVSNSNVTNRYSFKYWEIGNECYGTWETDSNALPHDPYSYASHVPSYLQQMKAADPTIKVGVVVANGEDSYANGYTGHPATNLLNGTVHYGWTPVVLSTLRQLSVTPDFAIFHWYPEYTGQESDPLLLQGTSSWKANAANLRQMITSYFGAGGTNIELVCTENNSNSGTQGKQSVSLVNGLYYADSLAQLMQTELNSFIWWDLRNGVGTAGSMDPTLYGWRMYGDLGLLNGSGAVVSNRYPQFYTARLMQHFVRGGDTVLSASSDYPLLTAYAARRADGQLTTLVINKDPIGSFTAQIALNGFAPGAGAAIYSYGMPQDNAAQTGIGSPDVAQTNFVGAATNFTYNFAPYSATVFSFAPSPPSLVAFSAPQSNQLVLEIQGQPGIPYVVQTTTNLAQWTSVATNAPGAATLYLTNTIVPGAGSQFWRAVWQP
jgi:hypothetical protein